MALLIIFQSLRMSCNILKRSLFIPKTDVMANKLDKRSKSPSDIVGAIQPKVSPFDQAVFKVAYLEA